MKEQEQADEELYPHTAVELIWNDSKGAFSGYLHQYP